MTPEHPDHHTNYARLKAINRGSRQAIEDKAIAEYMRVFDEQGREEAEEIYFSFFNNNSHAQAEKQTREDQPILVCANDSRKASEERW
jgi:hypothetical protein